MTAGGAGKGRDPDGSTDYGPLPHYLGYQIRRAQASLFAAFAGDLGDLDVTPGAVGLLVLIRHNPGITQMQLGAAFGIDKSTLTPVLNRLERRGLIRRSVLERDRRFNALMLNPEAGALLSRIFARVEAFERGVADRLGPADADSLARILGRLQSPAAETALTRD